MDALSEGKTLQFQRICFSSKSSSMHPQFSQLFGFFFCSFGPPEAFPTTCFEFLCNLSLSLSYSPPAGGGAAPPWREIAFLSNFPFTLIFKKKSLKSEYRNNTEPSPHLSQKSLSFSGGNSRPTFRRSATPDPTPDNNGCLSHSPSPPPISNGPGVKKTKGFG